MKVATNTGDELRRLAIIGAKQRLIELDAEEERLLAKLKVERDRLAEMFPELAKKRRAKTKDAEPSVIFDANEIEHETRSIQLGKKPPPQKSRPTYTDAVKRTVLKRLKRGDYVPDIQRASGVATTTINRWARGAKIKPAKMSLAERGKRTSKARQAKAGKPAATKERKRGQHYSAEFKAAAVERARNGEPAIAVDRSLGIPINQTSKWCRAAGVKIADNRLKHAHKGAPGGNIAIKSRAIRPEVPHDKRAQLIERVKNGESPTRVARELGVNPSTARGWFADSKKAKAGVKVRANLKLSVPPEIREKAIARVKAGEKPRVVFEDLGVKMSQGKNWLHDAKISVRELAARAANPAPNGVHKEA